MVFALATAFTLQGILPPAADAQSIFKPYIEGSEAARDANRRDQQYYNEIRRQNYINELIQAYNDSGDYAYLCEAAEFGSIEARHHLLKRKVRCY